jgi:hypothetical protein
MSEASSVSMIDQELAQQLVDRAKGGGGEIDRA